MRNRFLAIGALLIVAGCVDRPPLMPPPEPEPEPPPTLGVYRFTLTGIGTPEVSASAELTHPPEGPSMSLGTAPAGLGFEIQSASSFTEGLRTGDNGQRYITFMYRVRNSTGAPLSNVTLVPVTSASTIAGTPFLQLRKFDGTAANTAIASMIVPTGAVALGEDGHMRAIYPDVLQAYEESEVAAISLPAGKTGIFPYGFVVRNANNGGRTLPAATGTNDFGGTLTFAFRLPLAATGTEDPFTIIFDAIAIQDTETRMTESMEEARDTAAVRRLRARATALSATTVTVLNGSGRMSPAEPNYPGQRQLCSVRTAGTAGSPVTLMNAPAAYTQVLMLFPGETRDTCAANFRTGTAGRPATNVWFTLHLRALDRYGNLKTAAVDTVALVLESGPPGDVQVGVALTSGAGSRSVMYSDYGTSVVRAQGRRNAGRETITVAGVTRIWRGVTSTDWTVGSNWLHGATPMSLDSVLIPNPKDGPHYPVLVSNVSIHGVTVENGATISIGPFNLTAAGNVTTGTSGGIDGSSGRVVLTGVARTVHGVLPRIRVTGTYSLTGNLSTRAPLEVPLGRLTNTSFRVQTTSF